MPFVSFMLMCSACTFSLHRPPSGHKGCGHRPTNAWPAAGTLSNADWERNISARQFVAAGSGSSIPGEYTDNRTVGERAKEALPGTGRDSSTTGHSTGQGYGQEGRGLTSGTATGKILHCLAPCGAAGCCTVWLCCSPVASGYCSIAAGAKLASLWKSTHNAQDWCLQPALPVAGGFGSNGTGSDSRTTGQQLKSAIPGTAEHGTSRGTSDHSSSSTGHSSGHRYGQDGLTSGAGELGGFSFESC